MKRPLRAFLVLACFNVILEVPASYVHFETVQVPIDRVLKNLQARFAANTNDLRTIYQLARVHSMAYSTNFSDVPMADTNFPTRPFSVAFYRPGETQIPQSVQTNRVQTVDAQRHLTNAINYYHRAKKLIRWEGTNRWLFLPIYLGHAWCLEQSGDPDKARDAYREAFRYAWEIEVEGTETFKERMQRAWNRLRRGRMPGRRRSLGTPPHFSEEIISYLLPLLDPAEDAAEIAKLKSAQKKLKRMPRAITPILVALKPNAPLESLVDRSAAVPFDLDGTGILRRYQWIRPTAAWLVYDHAGAGRITSALQLFGNVTFWIFWQDGYEALSLLDDDQNGFVEGGELRHLALWRDENSNGQSESGEVRPLNHHRIVKLKTGATAINGTLSIPDGAQLSDGTSLPTYDWVAKSAHPRPQITAPPRNDVHPHPRNPNHRCSERRNHTLLPLSVSCQRRRYALNGRHLRIT